jgi:hypothetical protein
VVGVAVPSEDDAPSCLAQPHCCFDKGVQDRLQIKRRAADDLEYVGGRGLLLEGLAQLVD